MSFYALTDSDWPWDDEYEGRAIVVEADNPQNAVIKATKIYLSEFPGAGGITWKVAELFDVGFQGADWENDNQPNFDEFVFYSDTIPQTNE